LVLTSDDDGNRGAVTLCRDRNSAQ